MLTKPLSASQVEAINLEYGINLSYDDATHYRAALVIFTLAHQLKAQALATGPGADSPAAVQAPAGTA
jgi:hypothetical protein